MCVSLSYTRGVRGDKWRSGVRKAAFSPGPPITSRAVRETDRSSLSFSFSLSKLRLGKWSLRKLSPHLCCFYLQRKLEDQIEDLFMFHFNGTRQRPHCSPRPRLRLSSAEKDFPKTSFLDQEEAECLVTLLGIKRQHDALHLHRTF